MIFLHYCSSDVWSGDKLRNYQGTTVPFKGKLILEEIIKEVIADHPAIHQAQLIVLAGDSAGSIGTQNNGDRIASLLAS